MHTHTHTQSDWNKNVGKLLENHLKLEERLQDLDREVDWWIYARGQYNGFKLDDSSVPFVFP